MGGGVNAFDQTSVILSQSGVELPIVPNVAPVTGLFSCDPGKAGSMTLGYPGDKSRTITATLTFHMLTCASFCDQTQADIRVDSLLSKGLSAGGICFGLSEPENKVRALNSTKKYSWMWRLV
jgi:hypothetical protein